MEKRMSSDNGVGVVGLGIMGGAIARNLVAAGFPVIGTDIDAERRRELQAAGVAIKDNAAGVAAAVPTVLTSLPTESALATVVREIAAAGLPRRVIVEMSTFTLDDKLATERVLREAGHIMLDCPLSGTGAQAKVKDLVVYASGNTAAIASLRPVFAGFAREAHDLGAFGNGSRMKYVANLLVAIHNVAAAEGMVLARKAGLDPQQVLEVIGSSAGSSRMWQVRGPMMVAGRYDEPTMRVGMWHKDLKIIGQFAAGLGCPTPLMSATLPIYAAALDSGYGDSDTASVCAVLETMAGVKR
jgi:3-hydroxyisobutyrate dehydrogenase-like beta-hydroxyacid dehydrogenase